MSPVTTVLLVARREMTERVRNRAFLISTAITTGLVVAFIAIPPLLFGGDDPTAVGVAGDRARELATAIEGRASVFDLEVDVEVVDATAGEERVASGDLDLLVSVDEIVVEDSLGDLVGGVVAAAIDDLDRSAPSTTSLPSVRRLSQVDPDLAERREVVALVTTVVLLVVINAYGATVMTGVLEEKQTRVVELVLATMSPRQLLAGKVLGLGLLGLGQLLLVAAAGVTAIGLTGSISLPSGATAAIVASVIWFVLGYALYSVVYAAAGATVNRMEDAQSAVGPLTVTVMASYLATLLVVAPDPTSLASRILTQLPPVAPFAVPARVARQEIEVWEIALATGLTLAAIVVAVRLAGRLYTGAILRTGGRTSFREAWRSAAELEGSARRSHATEAA